jgi:hypothetical protein
MFREIRCRMADVFLKTSLRRRHTLKLHEKCLRILSCFYAKLEFIKGR